MTTEPYEQTGRRRQKARTRRALVAAARDLLARGAHPTVEEAAELAEVSRTTAYRYFPNQRSLLAAAHPEIEQESLLGDDAPDDPEARVDAVLTAHLALVREWEPQLRAALRLSLEPGAEPTGPALRRGRAIRWFEEALAPLRRTRPELDLTALAVAIRAATGIESYVWLVDVAGLPAEEAAARLRRTGLAVLRDALTEGAAAARPGRCTG